MKTLLAIIAAASLVVGCGVIEEEQTTTDIGLSNVSTTTTTTGDSGSTTTTTTGDSGSTTTTTDSGGGESTPTVTAESLVMNGRIAAGKEHTCAIRPAHLTYTRDTVACWGYDGYGQSTVPSGLGSVKSIATSQYHTCAIKADDSVQCWGWDINGQGTVPAELQ